MQFFYLSVCTCVSVCSQDSRALALNLVEKQKHVLLLEAMFPCGKTGKHWPKHMFAANVSGNMFPTCSLSLPGLKRNR